MARVLYLTVKDKKQLYTVYMPYTLFGGLFIPTSTVLELGEPVSIFLSLLNEPERLSVSGKVCFITPKGAQGNRAAGVGVQFDDNDDGKMAKRKIEGYLAGMLNSDQTTHTM
jgi:type IV pilus assembly protein PilZ